jgi:hypothetical protein
MAASGERFSGTDEADLIDNPDGQVGEREAVLTLSVLVGAIAMARAVDDPDLSQRMISDSSDPGHAVPALQD